jgi:hypothetical protein
VKQSIRQPYSAAGPHRLIATKVLAVGTSDRSGALGSTAGKGLRRPDLPGSGFKPDSADAGLPRRISGGQ